MKASLFSIAALLGALPAIPARMITARPEPPIPSPYTTAAAAACTSTECWAAYTECHGSLTFVNLCYTPPPCGTATSPAPFQCPPASTAKPTSTASSVPDILRSIPYNHTFTATPTAFITLTVPTSYS
ncbi:hypothetical protein GGS21DRAFT_159456 [Xylaria nigripes]|nr:hypothetical protein GGS21DRAFT_159456 [Xylaria nigripes]